MKLRLTFLALAACALVLAPVATAHVEISPEKVQADSFARLSIRVPTERNVPTVKLEVKLPPGLDEVSVQTKPGWKSSNNGGLVTWSGGKIGPGEFDEFGLSVHVPNTPGKELLFPALQTYADGKVVHWIGPEDAEEPAPRVTLEAASGNATTTTSTAATSSKDDEEDGHDGLALGFGIAGLAAGLLALGATLMRRRRA
jgi:uncharacterized protein YcnI